VRCGVVTIGWRSGWARRRFFAVAGCTGGEGGGRAANIGNRATRLGKQGGCRRWFQKRRDPPKDGKGGELIVGCKDFGAEKQTGTRERCGDFLGRGEARTKNQVVEYFSWGGCKVPSGRAKKGR